MPKPDYDTTVARMAGNIAAGLVNGPDSFFGMANECENLAKSSVALARVIVAEVRRTEPVIPSVFDPPLASCKVGS